MLKRFEIDPTFVREALMEGRTLLVEVSEHHTKVSLGPKSKHLDFAAAIAKHG